MYCKHMTALTDNVDIVRPTWPAPANITAACSLRVGGASDSPFGANVALHVDDNPDTVLLNRRKLLDGLGITACSWLNQVHGTVVVSAASQLQTADAVVTREQGIACAVMTADCLPILITDTHGSVVAALHCGWRSLAGGLVESSVKKMGIPSGEWMAWLGPAIGPDHFEVGDDVVESFQQQPWFTSTAFTATTSDKYLANLYLLARAALTHAGITRIYGGEYCTVRDNDRFFSYRKERVTGRMVSLIQINASS